MVINNVIGILVFSLNCKHDIFCLNLYCKRIRLMSKSGKPKNVYVNNIM